MATFGKEGYCSKWKKPQKREQLCDYFDPKRRRLKPRCRNCKHFRNESECSNKKNKGTKDIV